MKSTHRQFIDDNFPVITICLLGTLVALAGSNFVNILRSADDARAFQTRTVDRWDKLQRDNPQLHVPKIDEPIVNPHLTDAEMERKK